KTHRQADTHGIAGSSLLSRRHLFQSGGAFQIAPAPEERPQSLPTDPKAQPETPKPAHRPQSPPRDPKIHPGTPKATQRPQSSEATKSTHGPQSPPRSPKACPGTPKAAQRPQNPPRDPEGHPETPSPLTDPKDHTGTPKAVQFQPLPYIRMPPTGPGCPLQPGPEHPQGRGIHSPSGQPVPGPHRPLREEFPPNT
uniref:Uncharacterized protein n=1 Tax=Anas platyrhynchos platyrhynchos TaxID=8840 RepID=A0A493TZP0_ANAPP